MSLFLVVTQTGWAGFQAYFTVDLLNGLFGWGLAKNSIMLFGCIASVLMVINNVVGFHGIATFARKIERESRVTVWPERAPICAAAMPYAR